MRYEVELKHRVENKEALLRRLEDLGIVLSPPMEQSDQYFAHPSRDFARTDEALRIRKCGEENLITYKGPKLDAVTKTRHELELSFGRGDSQRTQLAELLSALGFQPVATVRKRRCTFEIDHRGHKVQGALDEVDHLGTFLELELCTDEQTLEQIKHVIQRLSDELRPGPTERRSYLEMLLGSEKVEVT